MYIAVVLGMKFIARSASNCFKIHQRAAMLVAGFSCPSVLAASRQTRLSLRFVRIFSMALKDETVVHGQFLCEFDIWITTVLCLLLGLNKTSSVLTSISYSSICGSYLSRTLVYDLNCFSLILGH